MKTIGKIIAVLTGVCILCAFLLAFVDEVTREKIEQNNQRKIYEAISVLSPGTKHIEETVIGDAHRLYKLLDKERELLGYGFIAEGQGYAGTIEMLGVADPFLRNLKGIEILKAVETPGLGGEITTEGFKNQFKSINLSGAIECVKDNVEDDRQIKAITGATISSRSVVNILNKKIEMIRQSIKEQ